MVMHSNLYVGPAGWSYDDWLGTVYPSPRPRGFDPLAYLAGYFNLIEINSTFYRVPTRDMTRSWVDRVAFHPSFTFTAKLHQRFTHDRSRITSGELDPFIAAMTPLREAGRLASVLAQFPWSVRDTPNARHRIAGLAQALSPIPLVVEVRHATWATESSRAFFREHQLTLCSVDQPLLSHALGANTYEFGSGGGYFRLHGRNQSAWFDDTAGRNERYNYLYDENELEPMTAAIKQATAGGIKTHVVLNNHFRGQAPANALEIVARLTGPVVVPPPLLETYPRLREIAKVGNDGT